MLLSLLLNKHHWQGEIRVYYVFDLVMLDGKDLRSLPLVARKFSLQRLLKKQARLIYVDSDRFRFLG